MVMDLSDCCSDGEAAEEVRGSSIGGPAVWTGISVLFLVFA